MDRVDSSKRTRATARARRPRPRAHHRRRVAQPADRRARAARACGPRPTACAKRCSTGSASDSTACACLDLFAGSGALGFEAASRGAARVVMVESDRAALRGAARAAARALGAARGARSSRGDALDYLARAGERFDVVFLDPPFRQNAAAGAAREAAAAPAAGRARLRRERRRRSRPRRRWRELKRGARGAGELPTTANGDDDDQERCTRERLIRSRAATRTWCGAPRGCSTRVILGVADSQAKRTVLHAARSASTWRARCSAT